MYKRTLNSGDGQIGRASASPALFKPFKTPSLSTPQPIREQPKRKRQRVSYKGAQGSDTDDDDSGRNGKKKKRARDGNYVDTDILNDTVNINKVYPVFKVKPFEQVSAQRFAIPTMKNAAGEMIKVAPSGVSLGIRPQAQIIPRPLHDPMAEHAIVLYDPTIDTRETDEERKERLLEEEKEARKKALEEQRAAAGAGLVNPHKSLRDLLGGPSTSKKKIEKVPVVIDPRLTAILRPHQIEGVQFLYKCSTGMVVENQYGCIMADGMGLGKTLQCISLMWTLLKQSPRAGKPTVEKCIIACPSSLVKNWASELIKWLGKDTVGALAIDGKGGREVMIENVRRWVNANGRNITLPIMIISYESLRGLAAEELSRCPIGLLLCDEGHRLKNSESQTFQALNSLQVQRRVIISGTPIQNDLSEYFALLNFVNPNFLGSKGDFRKNFEHSIIRGRDADASDKVKEECEKKLKELATLVAPFIIRRTNELLSKYLPIKYEQVVFCELSDLQRSLYEKYISSSEAQKILRAAAAADNGGKAKGGAGGMGTQSLKAINILKKLCNHPELLDLPNDIPGCDDLIPEGFVGASGESSKELTSRMNRYARQSINCAWSGKFLVLERFLERMRSESNDKIVLISNYTSTLDLFEKMCRAKSYGFFRLDGTMSIPKRQKLVEKFNDPEGKEFIFLLSSKAGGCGINLIGANRLVLFDPDWNPAADQQALARVWRDGQKKECFVYRFIATGTIEEKIFQRQASKQALSACVVDEKEDTERHFSAETLRQLFLYKRGTLCQTHDTFKCKRCRDGKQFIKAPALLYGDASTWNHFTNPELRHNHDDLLRAEVGLPDVSFVFQYISH